MLLPPGDEILGRVAGERVERNIQRVADGLGTRRVSCDPYNRRELSRRCPMF